MLAHVLLNRVATFDRCELWVRPVVLYGGTSVAGAKFGDGVEDRKARKAIWGDAQLSNMERMERSEESETNANLVRCTLRNRGLDELKNQRDKPPMAVYSTQGATWGRHAGQTLEGSFSAVPKPIFTSKYSFERSCLLHSDGCGV